MKHQHSLDLAAVRQFGNLEFLARHLVDGFITGLHKSPYHGFSVEFAEHAIYNAGESTRHIDWKIFAKTDRLYTKRYEEETNLRCQILIDTSASMYYPAATQGKLTFSCTAAACLAYMLHKQRDAVGFTFFRNEISYQSALRSTSAHLHGLFLQLNNLLATEPVQQETLVAPTLHTVADLMHKRSLIIVFSDLFSSEEPEELFNALQHLKHNKHEVILFQVADAKTELQFEFDDRPYEFIDQETGQKLKLRPQELKQAYTQQMATRMAELKLKCSQYRIDLVEVDIASPMADVLTAYLLKRQRMR